MNNNIIEKIHKETGYSFIKILSLIIKDNFKYGVNIDEFYNYKFYKLSDNKKSSYMSIKRNNKLIKKYNDKKEVYKIRNRNILYNIFEEFVNRKYLILDDSNLLEFKNFIKNKGSIIVRKIDGYEYEEINLTNKKINILYLTLFDNNVRLVENVVIEDKSFNKFKMNGKFTINFIVFKGKIIQETIKYDKKYYIIDKDKFRNKLVPYIDDLRKVVKSCDKKLDGLNYLYYEFMVSNKGIELMSVNDRVPIIQNEEVIINDKSYALRIKE